MPIYKYKTDWTGVSMKHQKSIYGEFGIKDSILELAKDTEEAIKEAFGRIEAVRETNQLKVIRALQLERLSDTHFQEQPGMAITTGAGRFWRQCMLMFSGQRMPL